MILNHNPVQNLPMVADGSSISSQLIGSHLRINHQHDNDYTFLEFQKLLAGEHRHKIHIVQEKRKQVTTLTKKLGPHVQYFILHEFITNPMFWHRHYVKDDQWPNAPKKEYDEFIARLSKNIQMKFFLETNSRITDHRYLRKNFKNKRCLIAFCVRNILKECPEMYNDDHQILKSLSKTYQGRLLYNSARYYGNCIRTYKKKYGSSNYPVERIDVKQFLFFIKFIKDTLL